MLELSIPQKGEKSGNAKDLIFTVLTQESPLSLMELTNRIKSQYNLRLTYQAIRKAVEKLNDQGVLKKEGKKYSISQEWLLELKTFFDKMLMTKDSGKTVYNFTKELAKEDYAVYTFSNLLDLDNFWGDMLMYLTKNIGPDEIKVAINYDAYMWWMLFNLGRETKIYKYNTKNKIKTYFLWTRDVPLNRWGSKVYSELGFESKVKNIMELDESVYVNTVGDTVIQVKFSKDIMKKIRTYFEKYKATQEISMKDITKIAHEPCEVKFIIFRNPTLAKNIRDTYMKYFK
ncbi:MAG: hypothetical protein ABH828_03805 [archaeon]